MRSIKELITQVANILMELTILNFKSVAICQKLGFNGFKRWHKLYAKKYYDEAIYLEEFAYSDYSILIDSSNFIPVEYSPKNIVYHFQLFQEHLEKQLSSLGSINKEFYELTGFCLPVSKCLEKMLNKQKKKCCRLAYRYKSIGSEATGLHDLHMIDDELHDKLKKKEEKHGRKHYK